MQSVSPQLLAKRDMHYIHISPLDYNEEQDVLLCSRPAAA